MTFYEELQAATERERADLLAAPIIRAAMAGEAGLSAYIAFLAEAYHHVKHTVPLLMACGARLPEHYEWLRQALAGYIGEEMGHQEWILDDIRACCGDADAVRAGQPAIPTEVMVAYAYDTIQLGNPVGFLGMVFVLEGTSVQLAHLAANGLRASLGLPEQAFTYLTSHGSLDVSHVQYFESLVNRLDCLADRAAIVRCAMVFYRLYGDIFRQLGEEA